MTKQKFFTSVELASFFWNVRLKRSVLSTEIQVVEKNEARVAKVQRRPRQLMTRRPTKCRRHYSNCRHEVSFNANCSNKLNRSIN